MTRQPEDTAFFQTTNDNSDTSCFIGSQHQNVFNNKFKVCTVSDSSVTLNVKQLYICQTTNSFWATTSDNTICMRYITDMYK